MLIKKFRAIKHLFSRYSKVQLKNFSEDIPIEGEPNLNGKKNRRIINLDNYQNVKCLILHPIFPENLGPHLESYLAEEAVGLARSLNWDIIKGPFWGKENDKYDPDNWNSDSDVIPEESYSLYRKYRKQKDENKNIPRVRDGDYIYTDGMQGVYYKGGIICDIDEAEDNEEEVYDKWKNILLRQSIANSSLVTVKKIKASTFFSKGRLNELGDFIKTNKINALFVNTVLTPVQQRNLQIYFNNVIKNYDDRVRAYYIKSSIKEDGDATATSSNFSCYEDEVYNAKEVSIKVFDRFNIIISIFAQRAQNKLAKLQIELAWLKYAKSKLSRGGHTNLSMIATHFTGDLFDIEVEREVVSAKQKGVRGAIVGSGESQLELEKRKIFIREKKIIEELEILQKRRERERELRKKNSDILPLIAIVGYTNAGKTALMNFFAHTDLESQDKLFQTLNTTIKKFFLPNKQHALLLDTIGFITNLPHELIECFKSTLEEIINADILIHVIDISNPNFEYQRKTVYSVLNEIFPNINYNEKIIEVWNKIDLLENSSKIDDYLKDNKFTIVPLSAKYGINYEMLLDEIIIKMNKLKGKTKREIRITENNYHEVFDWIKENITFPDSQYDIEREEMVIYAMMDDNQYERYLDNFVYRKKKNGKVFNKEVDDE